MSDEKKSLMPKRIYEMRNKLGLTQEELGKKVGVSKSSICKWENGDIENIPRGRIDKMAELFHCRPSWLMDLDDDDVTVTYQTPGKEPLKVKIDPESTPIIGQAGLRARLLKAAARVLPENLETAIEVLEALTRKEE